MPIRIYNTMSRDKQDFVPREEGKVSIYVCGPTVYNYIHLGNARTFLNFDMIRRYLQFAAFEVTFVQNVTDVDDKIINRANEEGTTADSIAAKYRRAFEEDMAALGVEPPDIVPAATEHIEDMVSVIGTLVDRGYAYESEGDVYFDVSEFEGYGALSGRDLDEQQVTVQGDAEIERKRDPWDFALWKAAKPGEPSWDSPWGPGRPGWHIECSTMSVKYLGPGFDIHGGGQDLIFPHHENEIAQAEAYAGAPFVRYWMHSGMLNIDQEKMSKSLGNIKRLREVLEEHDPDTVRMLMLGTHYRSPLNFSDESLAEAAASLERIENCLFNLDDLIRRLEGERGDVAAGAAGAPVGRDDGALDGALAAAAEEFQRHMEDDFNSAAALGAVFGAVREINSYADRLAGGGASTVAGSLAELRRAREFIERHCSALGLFQAPGKEAERGAGPDARALLELTREAGLEPDGQAGPDELVEALLAERQAARARKDFALADRIRDGVAALGIKVEDVRDGYRWRFER